MAKPERLTPADLAAALEDLGVDVDGWCQVSVPPEGKERWWTQGFQLGDWVLVPGGKKASPNFAPALAADAAWLNHRVYPISYLVGSVEELAEVLGNSLDPDLLGDIQLLSD